MAGSFCKQYATAVPHKTNKKTRKVLRSMRIKHKLVNDFKPFSVQNVEDAIKVSKSSSAVGPDGLTAIHYKHRGQSCMRYLTELFNLLVCHANIPVVWKSAIVVRVLKPGKPPEISSSYRPISLSPAVKAAQAPPSAACDH
jgi:hypothetical protein